MSLSIPEFEAKGWFISREGIDLIAQQHPEAKSLDDYLRCAKDMDLRSLTSEGINKTKEKLTQIPSPVVLQVVEVRNIAMPSINQIDQNPRLLSVLFTDGKAKYKGVEMNGKLDCIKLHTPPGTKYLVTKPIEIKDQVLLLEPGSLKELGGNVQELVQAWRAGKHFIKRNRSRNPKKLQDGTDASDQNGPPSFVPYTVKANSKNTRTMKSDAVDEKRKPKLVKKKAKSSEDSTVGDNASSSTEVISKDKENVDKIAADDKEADTGKDSAKSAKEPISTVDEDKASRSNAKKTRRKQKTTNAVKDDSSKSATTKSEKMTEKTKVATSKAVTPADKATSEISKAAASDKEHNKDKADNKETQKEAGEESKQKKTRKTTRKEKASNSKRNTDDSKPMNDKEQPHHLPPPDSDDDFDINQIINGRRNKRKPQSKDSRKKTAPSITETIETREANVEANKASNTRSNNAAPASDASSKKRKSRNKKKTTPASEKPNNTEATTASVDDAKPDAADNVVVTAEKAPNVDESGTPTTASAIDKKTTKKVKSKSPTDQQTKEKKQTTKKTHKKAVSEQEQQRNAQQPNGNISNASAEILFDKNEITKDLAADFKPHFAERLPPRFQQRLDRNNRYYNNSYNENRRGGFYNNSRRLPKNIDLPSQKQANAVPASSKTVKDFTPRSQEEKLADANSERGKLVEEKATEDKFATLRPKRKTKKQREFKSAEKAPRPSPSVHRSTSSPVPSSAAAGEEDSPRHKTNEPAEGQTSQQTTMQPSTSEPSSLGKSNVIAAADSLPQTQSEDKSKAPSTEKETESIDKSQSGAQTPSYGDQPPPYHPVAQPSEQEQPIGSYASQPPMHDYYYAQQQAMPSQPITSMYPPHPGAVEYNMMIPIDMNTGMPATAPATTPVYNYDPHTTYQMQMAAAAVQQSYIPTVYYVPPEQQPYYMQPHYTQLYDQNSTPYYQQYQQTTYQYSPNHGYRSNRGGRTNSNNANNGVMAHSSSNNSNSTDNTNSDNRNGKGSTKQ